MERRAHNLERITLRVRRGSATDVRRLELCGHRVLAGHADTGIFRLVESETLRATPQSPKRASRCDDDGLATATIEIKEPLAFAEQARHEDPYNRGGRTTR